MKIDSVFAGSQKFTSDKNIDARVSVTFVRNIDRASEYASEVIRRKDVPATAVGFAKALLK